jgi:hypothetical protein
MAEVVGVPNEVVRAFSQRRGQVLAYLEQQGASGFYAAKVGALETRERKEAVDLARLREQWWARAAELGFGRLELEALVGRGSRRALDAPASRDAATRLLGPEGLTEKQNTFRGPDVVMAWAEAHRQGAPVETIFELAGRFLASEHSTAHRSRRQKTPCACGDRTRSKVAVRKRRRRRGASVVSPDDGFAGRRARRANRPERAEHCHWRAPRSGQSHGFPARRGARADPIARRGGAAPVAAASSGRRRCAGSAALILLLAEAHTLTFYDAVYAAAARLRGAALATADRALLDAGVGESPGTIVGRLGMTETL